MRVTIQNSRLYNNNAGAIVSNPTGGNVLLTIDDTSAMRGAGQGIHVVDLTSATINNTTVAEFPNGGGLTIEASTAAASVSNSTFTNNGFGVASGAGGGTPVTRLYATTITGNTSVGLASPAARSSRWATTSSRAMPATRPRPRRSPLSNRRTRDRA